MISDKVHGADLAKKIETACKQSLGALAGPGPYVKLAPLAAQVKAGVGLAGVVKTLATKKDSKDSAEAAEATAMYDAITGNMKEQFDDATEKKTEEPLVALAKFERLAALFNGDDLAKKAAKEAADMRKLPAVQKELEGEMKWKYIQGLYGKLKPGAKGSRDPADESFRKANMEQLQVIVAGCRNIATTCAKTSFAEKAQELIDQFVAPTTAPGKTK